MRIIFLKFGWLIFLLAAGCASEAEQKLELSHPRLMLIDCRDGTGKIISDQEIKDTSSAPADAPLLPLPAEKWQ